MDPQSSSMAPTAEAVTVGGYQVLGRLAVGGMSELFLAQETVAGEALRYVVIKLLPAAGQALGMPQPDAEELFLREGRTLLRLDHPNICYSYAFGSTGTRRYIAMEWIDGVSLRELLIALREQGRGIAFHLSANLIAQVAAGLEHAHTARDARRAPLRVVHRDVNPTNVMIRFDGVVKLIDFGVAQVAERSSEVNIPLVRGKLAYMAPEQVRGEQLDHRADVFALGVCLYELLTGTRLYRRGSAKATAGAVLQEDVPSPRAVDANVPEELDEVVRKALQKDPAGRFASAGELQGALEDYLVKASRPMGARPLAALMSSVFPGRGGEPHVEALVDVAERFSDPGPLPSATTPRNDTVRPAGIVEHASEWPMQPIEASPALDASGVVPTELATRIEAEWGIPPAASVAADAPSDQPPDNAADARATLLLDSAPEDERPTIIFDSVPPAEEVHDAAEAVSAAAAPVGEEPSAAEAPSSAAARVELEALPVTVERPRRMSLYLGLSASLLAVAAVIVWSSARPAQSGASAGRATVRPAPRSNEPAGPAQPEQHAPSSPLAPSLTSSSIAGDEAAAAPSIAAPAEAAEATDAQLPERKARVRKPRSSPGFIADPGF